jgi:hypothetical protein
VSFVNSICTSKGGTHVDYLVNQISKFMCDKLNKKSKAAAVKPFMVKNHLWVFANAQVVNPAFDSQTKETLTTKASSFGSKCELPAPLLEKIAKCAFGFIVCCYFGGLVLFCCRWAVCLCVSLAGLPSTPRLCPPHQPAPKHTQNTFTKNTGRASWTTS